MKTDCTQYTVQCFGRLFALLLLATASVHAATRVTSVSGTVHLYSANGKSRPAVAGDVLQPGESIVTSYLSEAAFETNGASVTVEENSSVSESDGEVPEPILLNYGIINGQVSRSAAGTFTVYTPLGVPEIAAGSFMVNSIFNVERQEMILQVKNMDGRVGLRSRYAGTMEYGRHYAGDKNYNGAMTEGTAEIPPQHMAIIRLPVRDPYFFDRVDSSRHVAPEAMAEGSPVDFQRFAPRETIFTQEDFGVQVQPVTTGTDTTVISPNGPS